jgi:hypothetical protein
MKKTILRHAAIACAAILLPLFSTASAQQPSGGKPNLLTNASFEEDQKGWDFHCWHSQGKATIDTVEKKDGKASIRIDNAAGDDSFLKQTIAVKPKTRYRMSGYIRTKDVVGKGAGATLSLEGGFEKTEVIATTKSWTKVSFEFDSGANSSIKVGPRLGHYSSNVMGTAWFDELSLVELGPARKR